MNLTHYRSSLSDGGVRTSVVLHELLSSAPVDAVATEANPGADVRFSMCAAPECRHSRIFSHYEATELPYRD